MTASASTTRALDGAARRTPSAAPASGPGEVSPGPDVTPAPGVQGYVIDGVHTRQRLADILPVINALDGNRVLASARYGPRGWYVSVEGFVCEIYVESKADAQACLAGVRGALL